MSLVHTDHPDHLDHTVVHVPDDLHPPPSPFYLAIFTNRSSTSLVKWAAAHSDILVQQRPFEAQRALRGCWQKSRENGLFPCILCDQCVHFLTINTPPTSVPLAESYDGIFTLSLGVLLHDSETNALAILRSPFHVEDPPVVLRGFPTEGAKEGGAGRRNRTAIVWTSALLPLFLAHHPGRQRWTLYTVGVQDVRPIYSFSSEQPLSPTLEKIDSSMSNQPKWKLWITDSRWVLLMQSNNGEMMLLQDGDTLEEVGGRRRRDSLNPPPISMEDVDMEAGEDVGDHDASPYESMLRIVDAERQLRHTRASSLPSSLNVLNTPQAINAGAPTDDIQNLPFHLAYAVLVERRDAIKANDDTNSTAKVGMDGQQEQDTRSLEARELLSSTRPVVLKSQDVDGTEDDSNNRYQQQLLQASSRTLALALGRGAMGYGTYDALPTEMLQSPDIDLSGRIVERNDAIVTLDISSDPQASGGGALSDRTAWPEFQNGTASALRINKDISNLSRTWIVYNKPKTPSYDHAGFLFGLGLTGQLACLTVTDLYRYLSHEHDATLVGVLLGMSASKRGSMDATLTKMLFLHMPSQHPLGYPDLEIAPVVQCASLLGVGMLFQGTGQRSIAEMLLGEIDSNSAVDEVKKGGGYSLMAGFGLGLVMSSGNAINGRELYEEELGWLMKGGRKKKGKEGTGMRKEEKKKGGNAVQEELLASQRRPRTLLEQDLVPQGSKEGACIALGMIWMRSMEERVFDMMALEPHLDPEDVMLRVWMRCLIMWEDDLSTWLDMNQIKASRSRHEEDIARNAVNTNNAINADSQMKELGRGLGVHLALACKFAGLADTSVRDYILGEVDWMLGIKLRATDAAVREVVEMAICFSVLSAAVVMTGTRDLTTFGYVRALMNCSGLYCGSVWYEVLGLGAGLLFLGGEQSSSRWSFGTKPEDLAYLIIAMYPSSTPLKYWSFCRHLWVLSGGQNENVASKWADEADAVTSPEDEAMAMESVLLRIRSCGLRSNDSDLQGLLDVFLSSCEGDQPVTDAVVESLVDRMLVS